MAPRRAEPILERLCVTRCRLSSAQQRIRELEALLALHRIAVPAAMTQVPPVTHNCFSQQRETA